MMPSKINIRQTFRAIRQLPVEVSLKQVEQWVQVQTIQKHPLPLFVKLKLWFKRKW